MANNDCSEIPVTESPEFPGLLRLLTAAYHALRSYQYGNSSTELAREMADELQKVIQKFGGELLVPLYNNERDPRGRR